MKTKARIAACVAAAFAVTACGPNIHVTTTAAPNASFETLHTFRVLTPPPRRTGQPLPDDPMLVNSIFNQVLHTTVTDAFLARGYSLASRDPDFTVAYYASSRERLNVLQWDYGYPEKWGGWPGPRPVEVESYTEGTVIIDVVNAQTAELLWRGRGQAVTSDDPAEFQKNLRQAVEAIVKRFPLATRLAAR